MDIIQTGAGIATIASLALALWSELRRRRTDDISRTNQLIIEERVRTVSNVMVTALQNVQLLIRRADDTSAPVVELQNMGRMIRHELIGGHRAISGVTEAVQQWKSGQVVPSVPPVQGAPSTE
jgi:hypothetical protein